MAIESNFSVESLHREALFADKEREVDKVRCLIRFLLSDQAKVSLVIFDTNDHALFAPETPTQ